MQFIRVIVFTTILAFKLFYRSRIYLQMVIAASNVTPRYCCSRYGRRGRI